MEDSQVACTKSVVARGCGRVGDEDRVTINKRCLGFWIVAGEKNLGPSVRSLSGHVRG